MCAPTRRALDHPLGTAIGPLAQGRPHGLLRDSTKICALTWPQSDQDFPEWEPCHNAILSAGICGFENIAANIDAVTGKESPSPLSRGAGRRVDGCIVRLSPSRSDGNFRIETGNAE